MALAILACSSAKKEKGPVTVATPVDPEGTVLGAMLVQVLEARGFTVADRTGFGTPDLVRAALVAGEVDVIIDYTGAGQYYHEGVDPAVWADPVKGFETIRRLDRDRFGLAWLTPAPANCGDAIAVKRDFAKANSLVSMEDFARYVNAGNPMRLACTPTFARSRFGLQGFQKAYEFALRDDQVLIDAGGAIPGMLAALSRGTGGIMASLASRTEPSIEKMGLVVLEDPRNVTPSFRPAPVVRGAVLKRYPEIEGLFSPIFATIAVEDLQHLDAQVAYDGRDPREMARQYLAARGFLKP